MLRDLPAPAYVLLNRAGAREALQRELAGFGSITRKRAAEYRRRITAIDIIDSDCIAAAVRGTREYVCTWSWHGGHWDHDCSCPVGFLCKHAYAFGLFLAQANPSGPGLDPRYATSAPPADEKLQARALAQLRSTSGSWSRRRPLEALLNASQIYGVDAFADAFNEALDESDPEITAWKLALTLEELVGAAAVPAVLRPYLQRNDLRDRIAHRARAVAIAQLRSWVQERQAQGKKQIRFVAFIEIKPHLVISLEGRQTSSRLVDEPRTHLQLQQLRDEARRAPLILPPDDLNLLEAYLGNHQPYSYATRQPIDPGHFFQIAILAARSERLHWAAELPSPLAERVGIRPESPVRVDFTPVRIQPEVYDEGDRILTSMFAVWPDGRRRRLERCALFEPTNQSGNAPATLVSDGTLWQVIERPPHEILQSFTQAGTVEIPAEERDTLLPDLAATFDSIEASVRLHTRHIPAEPVVLLELRRDDWLRVRLFARERSSAWTPGASITPEQYVFERLPSGRWLRTMTVGHGSEEAEVADAVPITSESRTHLTAAPEYTGASGEGVADEDVWFEMPDTEHLEPVAAWIHGLGVLPAVAYAGRRRPAADDAELGLWLYLDAESIESFFVQWNSRPPGTYLGNRRLRRILSGAEVVRPKVKVTSSGTDWFSVSATWAAEGISLTDADLAQLRSAKSAFVRLPSGWVRRESIEAHDEAAATLADIGVEVGGGEQRVTLWQLAGASDASLQAMIAMGADPAAADALREMRQRVTEFSGVPELPLPKGLTAELRPYQRKGFDFLGYAAELGIGAVLADDMGLGKTVQALAWLSWLKETKRGSGPSLLVCPASVTHNWEREAQRFTPNLDVLVLGSGSGRVGQRRRWRKADLIVTNYALLRRDSEFWREKPLRAVILDEAQNIKNPDSVVAQVARALQAEYRLALTGTPLENRALDLWSLVEFVNPGYLGRRSDFSARFDRSDTPPHQRQLLAAKLRPIMLRRLKREVATELPERIEERIDCELTPGQRKLYLAELRRSRALVADLAGDADGLRRNKIQVLAALTRLRQICCHPGLVQADEKLGSGKFEALFELLETLLNEGHKVLLFSQFVRCLQRIEAELDRRSMPHHILTGKSRKREEIVRAFQEDERTSVFLVSLKAGGAGLNLTAASYVVLFDPWWNPAVEAQAIDRTHRIGQDKTVIAYRLLAAGTIEEKIFELQQRKATLARDVLGEDGFAKTLSRDDLAYLLSDD